MVSAGYAQGIPENAVAISFFKSLPPSLRSTRNGPRCCSSLTRERRAGNGSRVGAGSTDG